MKPGILIALIATSVIIIGTAVGVGVWKLTKNHSDKNKADVPSSINRDVVYNTR